MRSITISAAALGVIALGAACGTGSATHNAVSPAAGYKVACERALSQMYATLGGAQFGPGRFEAGVNAEAFAGTLPHACGALTRGQVMTIAVTVSHS
jgi:hypothetical protein